MTLTTLPAAGRDPRSATRRTARTRSGSGELGRAAQNLVGSLDAGLELAQGTTSYIYLGTRIVRGWAIELVLLTALLPFLIGAVDLFARCRRRRIPLAPAARSLRSRLSSGATRPRSSSRRRCSAPSRGRAAAAAARRRALYEPSPAVLGILGVLLLGRLAGRAASG